MFSDMIQIIFWIVAIAKNLVDLASYRQKKKPTKKDDDRK